MSQIQDAPAVVEAMGLAKVYHLGGEVVHALRGVDLCVRRGEFVAIMGASGSGKSTFMHILGCLDAPSKGSYRLEGRHVEGLPAKELARIRNQRLGFVFQGFNLLPRTSALDNVSLPLVYAHVPGRERRTRAMAALELVGLGGQSGHLTNQLSGGQQQRVAIARALVNEPAMILADEPTGNLDSRMSEEIMQIFTHLNSAGITIVIVTHEPDIAAFARRQVVFRDGLVVEDRHE